MPAVAIARTRERHRSPESVLSLVNDAIEKIGGIASFIKPGQTVLIKPDQSVPAPAETGSTTDPLMIGALIRLARIAGASRIQVAGSSEGCLDAFRCMRETGLAAIAEREGAQIIDLSRNATRQIDVPGASAPRRAALPVALIESDVMIAAPKAKTHPFDQIAGTIQLWSGLVSPNWRAAHQMEDMVGSYADLMTIIRPDLCVTDALICGEGDGPGAHVPHWCGCVLASTDPVAMDVSIALLLGCDPRSLRFAAAGEQQGVGSRAPIVWLGTGIEQVAFHSWKSHPDFQHLPINVLVGKHVTMAGTIGRTRNALDILLRRGELERILCSGRTPTVMIGDIEDPQFERHLNQGPYLVLDDAARPVYKNNPSVFFIGGHPIQRDLLPDLLKWLNADKRDKKLRPAAKWAAMAIGAALALRALSRS
jgi:uncharacterized protein (DUF362 family)